VPPLKVAFCGSSSGERHMQLPAPGTAGTTLGAGGGRLHAITTNGGVRVRRN